jgi:hypothetical protein
MVIDGQHDGRRVSLEVFFWNGRTLYQGEPQHESFVTLDMVKVMHDGGGAIYERSAHVTVEVSVLMAYRSPYGVMESGRFLVANSPAEMRWEYMLDRFSSKSTAIRWLLMTRTPCPRAFTYIISPERNMSGFLDALGMTVTVFILALW